MRRYWPHLTALWLAGVLAEDVLTEIAVRIGFLNQLAGLSALTLVVLVKLVVIIALFEIVRPGLPSLQAAAKAAEISQSDRREGEPAGFTMALSLALVPFFAFYAAWGFLSDTVREYSKLALDLTPFGQNARILEVSGGWLLLVSVAIAWLVRLGAKQMHKRSKHVFWPFLIVVCEANWAFIALYVLSNWHSEIMAWVSRLPETLNGWLSPVARAAAAARAEAVTPPIEYAPASWIDSLTALFTYTLYPVVWLTLAALVYGYDIGRAERPMESRWGRAIGHWDRLPKFLRDFLTHFVAGTARRYRALAEGVGLTFGAGLALVVTVIVAFRLLDWGAAWAWYGAARLIGPHEIGLWQIIAHALSILLGSPSAPGNGALIMPLKITLLAAGLETGFAQGRQWRSARRPISAIPAGS
ncbi:hypothetical protein FZC33_27670 [Labrys sp. KNU-23]|uniref:hypothetical protein n=1 Tax=Labrys sp. KNU-23 TaxID=2789216 RepID=UPI0011ECC776|nr:hypothetical protein [Labrys sp. KNU-23]QEN89857.1 hypothetical protein FZC33_27670 [Labrys sp. KNU-23]